MILEILFWVLAAAALVVVVGFWVRIVLSRRRYVKRWGDRDRDWRPSWRPHYGSTLWATLWVPAVAFGAWVIIGVITMNIVEANTDFTRADDTPHTLVALATASGTEGSLRGGIFLTVGHLDSERVISYIREGDAGGYVVRQVDADQAVIFEEDAKSAMIVHTWEKVNPLWTGDTVLDTAETYSFFVPTGSVVNTFEVAP